jgi:DAACS family dicarboxylate/amino acid:cation (Na+ or H+) symporter
MSAIHTGASAPVAGPRARLKLHNQILLGLVLGLAAGVTAHALAPDSEGVAWISQKVLGPVGQVFLRWMRMTVVPLVFASIVLGVAGIGDTRTLGRLGGLTLLYFLVSTSIAAVLGLALVNLVQPGEQLDAATRTELVASYASATPQATKVSVQWFVDIVPDNPVAAAARGDLLAWIFFSLLFGWALTQLPAERAGAMTRVVEALGDVVSKLIDLGMRLAPIGVFALIAVKAWEFGWSLLVPLGLYALLVLFGLLFHAAVVISLIVKFLGGMSPRRFWSAARASLITGFSTSSSNATLPTNLAVAVRDLGIDKRVAGFVLPLGATMNMNGTALYEGVTVLFLAQVFQVELTLVQQGMIVLMAVVTAVGAAGVPGGSLPLIMGVLATFGVPPESIAIILGVDRLLDMARTTVNVTGDLAAALVVERFEKPRAAAG